MATMTELKSRATEYQNKVGRSRAVTQERAKEARVNGWNLACQACGNFGCQWVKKHRTSGDMMRLCPICEEGYGRRTLALLNAERAYFSQDGKRIA